MINEKCTKVYPKKDVSLNNVFTIVFVVVFVVVFVIGSFAIVMRPTEKEGKEAVLVSGVVLPDEKCIANLLMDKNGVLCLEIRDGAGVDNYESSAYLLAYDYDGDGAIDDVCYNHAPASHRLHDLEKDTIDNGYRLVTIAWAIENAGRK